MQGKLTGSLGSLAQEARSLAIQAYRLRAQNELFGVTSAIWATDAHDSLDWRTAKPASTKLRQRIIWRFQSVYSATTNRLVACVRGLHQDIRFWEKTSECLKAITKQVDSQTAVLDTLVTKLSRLKKDQAVSVKDLEQLIDELEGREKDAGREIATPGLVR